MSTSPSYLFDRLRQANVSNLVLKRQGFDDIADLCKEVEHLMKEIARQQEMHQSHSLSAWLFGLLSFHPQHPITVQTIALSKSDQDAIEKLFRALLQKMFNRFSHRTDLLKQLFLVIDDWQRAYSRYCGNTMQVGLIVRLTVPEPNPFANEDERHYLAITDLLWALENTIIPRIDWRKLTPQEQFGGYLFFVVAQSGISQRDRLYRIAELSLNRQQMDLPFSGFLLMTDKNQNPFKAYTRANLTGNPNAVYRWIPDTVTKRIFESCRKNWQGIATDSDTYAACIQQFLQRLWTHAQSNPIKQKQRQLPKLKSCIDHLSHFPSLLKAGRAYVRRTLPSFIWHYLESTFTTKDLEPSTIERLHAFTYEMSHGPMPKIRAMEDSAVDPENDTTPIEADATIEWCDRISLILHESVNLNHPTQAIALLNQALGLTDYPLIQLISNWLTDALAQNTVDTSELIHYAEVLLPALIDQYSLYEDFKDWDNLERRDELEELVSAHVLQLDDEQFLRQAWHQLNAYLLKSGAISKEHFDPDAEKTSRTVDTEYISEREFVCIQMGISNLDIPVRLKNQCLVISMLAYRFGLRRSEAIHLAVKHVTLTMDLQLDMLAIRWWVMRRLKSRSSNRLLPINGMLLFREYLWLHLMALTRRNGEWVDVDLANLNTGELIQHIEVAKNKYVSRIASLNSPNRLPVIEPDQYFFIDEEKTSETRTLEIVNLIHHVMRSVIPKNKQLRFHHFRHTCAMNTLLLLLLPKSVEANPNLLKVYFGNEEGVSSYISGLEKPIQERFHQIRFDQAYLNQRSISVRQALQNQQYATTTEVYITSRMLGHSSPRTTLASYMHLMPILTGAFLYERFNCYSEDLQKALYSRHERTLKRNKVSAKERNETLLARVNLGRPTACESYISFDQYQIYKQ